MYQKTICYSILDAVSITIPCLVIAWKRRSRFIALLVLHITGAKYAEYRVIIIAPSNERFTVLTTPKRLWKALFYLANSVLRNLRPLLVMPGFNAMCIKLYDYIQN